MKRIGDMFDNLLAWAIASALFALFWLALKLVGKVK